MSHHGAHNWGAWGHEVSTNEAGEPQAGYVRYCTFPRCGAVDRERGAVIEPAERTTWTFELRQQVREEPSD